MLKLAVLISGSGSNLQAMLDRKAQGLLDVDFRLVLSNKADAPGLERARQAGVPALALDHRQHPDRESFDAAMVAAIREHGADVIALAGFMRILTPVFLNAFPGRVLNIHPALLPAFPGARAQRDAADYGVPIAGCTVHFVDEQMDHGPIVIQAAMPVTPGSDGDALARDILAWEHRIFPQALQWLAQGRLQLHGRHVRVAPAPGATLANVAGALINPPLETGF